LLAIPPISPFLNCEGQGVMKLITKKILFKNLPPNKTIKDLFNLLEPFGSLLWAYMPMDDKTKKSLGIAYVLMMIESKIIETIKNLHSFEWEGHALKVKILDNEITPEMDQDKKPLLISPKEFIYSAIRFQINAPPNSTIFINGIDIETIDNSGFTVLRGLLPGEYRVQVINQDFLLADKLVVLECKDVIPPFIVETDLKNAPRINVDSLRPNGRTSVKTRKPLRLLFLGLLILGVLGMIAVPLLLNRKAETPEGMVRIPGGKFIVGRDNGDAYESPSHEVTLSYDYFIDMTEVTNESYWKFIKATGRSAPANWNSNEPGKGILILPVTNVSWDDANSYCQWKGKQNGYQCQLPSEVEWEHAARGDMNFYYVWGNEWQENFSNANHPDGKIDPVGSHQGDVSPYGVKDMQGNVREWTSSDLTLYPGSKGAVVPNVKIIRGGAFSDHPDKASNTYRNFLDPNSRSYDRIGFRCVCLLQ
jgi:formylglycine-generating enzyme required for sulfatase activity